MKFSNIGDILQTILQHHTLIINIPQDSKVERVDKLLVEHNSPTTNDESHNKKNKEAKITDDHHIGNDSNGEDTHNNTFDEIQKYISFLSLTIEEKEFVNCWIVSRHRMCTTNRTKG